MEHSVEVHEGARSADENHCDYEACDEYAAVEFDGHPVCAAHFVLVSLKELDARAEGLKGVAYESAATSDLKDFLETCERQAKILAETEELGDPKTKKRAAEVLRRISKVSQSLRRSPRFIASVPVWLRREDPGRTWEEETWTSSLSLHGAGFSCHHAVEVGGVVVLCRRDKGNRVRAKVVYSRYDADGRREIGVELMETGDFWDLEKRMRTPDAEAQQTPAN